jgi:hypothetical protein
MLKEKIKETDEAQALKQSQWRNVIFSNDGQTVYGTNRFPTIDAARLKHESQLSEIMAGKVFKGVNGREITKENYSFCLQLPIMGEA